MQTLPIQPSVQASHFKLAQVSLVCPVTCFLTVLVKVNTYRVAAWLERTRNVVGGYS